ncbi:hypothetical protein SAMN05216223_104123 [Actinacidiphila yanglinensis]|uniref:Uncharacterized protein n=1 Tax=Actinacidiphila yanglinensis TaxID=310779 RepID=A0A1H5YRW7_9ACTN|nr:hypothetical protein [Actinacidiphila yanglinensis]SEG26949.1 hypothetical protein SAMN05216223_104123 [Actinacidiphila yanglinensis]
MSTPPPDGTAAPHGPRAASNREPGGTSDPRSRGMSAEDRVRAALHDAVRAVEPSPWRSAAVRQRAARLRRARRIAATLPVVTAVAACAVVMAAASHDRAPDRPAPPAVSTSAPTPSPLPTTPAPAVRVVQPGRPFSVGDGERMKLEPTRRCIAESGDVWQCDDLGGGNHPAGSLSSQNRGDAHHVVLAPLYTGPVLPARMTVTIEGRRYPVRLVTLPGHPGYASGYLIGPPPPGPDTMPAMTLRAFDADGTLMATLVSPASGSSTGTRS